MGKSYKRNSYFKPKQHGRIFEKKKDKWQPKKIKQNVEDDSTSTVYIEDQP